MPVVSWPKPGTCPACIGPVFIGLVMRRVGTQHAARSLQITPSRYRSMQRKPHASCLSLACLSRLLFPVSSHFVTVNQRVPISIIYLSSTINVFQIVLIQLPPPPPNTLGHKPNSPHMLIPNSSSQAATRWGMGMKKQCTHESPALCLVRVQGQQHHGCRLHFTNGRLPDFSTKRYSSAAAGSPIPSTVVAHWLTHSLTCWPAG